MDKAELKATLWVAEADVGGWRHETTHPAANLPGLTPYQTFGKVFPEVAVGSRKAESRAKVRGPGARGLAHTRFRDRCKIPKL